MAEYLNSTEEITESENAFTLANEIAEYSDLIQQFRSDLDISVEQNSDENVLCWLKASQFDLEKAINNFCMQYNFEQLIWPENNDPFMKKERKKVRELWAKYSSSVYLGFDKEDYVTILIPLKNMDLQGLTRMGSLFDVCILRFYAHRKFRRIHNERSKELGKKREYKISFIIDLEDFKFEELLQKSVIDFFLNVMKIQSLMFPGVMNRMIAVNAPFITYSIFALFKTVLRKEFTDRIVICDKDCTQEELLKFIDMDVIPAYLGGTRVDINGDPSCKAFIGNEIKIPEDLYRANTLPSLGPDTTTINIQRQTFEDVIVVIEKLESKIHIQFQSSDSIHFQILFRGNAQKYTEKIEEELSPSIKVFSHNIALDNILYCSKIGYYILRFDNTSSWITDVTVTYKFEIL